MKNTIKLAAIGALMVAGLAQSQGQTFNVSQPLNIALTGFAQSGGSNGTAVTAVHIGNKDVISSLASALGTTFSARAKLLVLSPSDLSSSSIIVRDMSGKTNLDTDVSGFFTMTTSVSVQKSHLEYSIDTFSFGSSGSNATTLSFTVQGITTRSLSNGSFTSQVNGSGTTTAGDTAVLKGNVSAGGTRKEKS